ncbi:hypothetical protein EU523_00455 [Candidatus Heimdallarchaeota archaeon]|nr:MAG: hypothetical protein EU523_00455 [Candidatus Heimdallarchaeota archaeon]
MTNNNSNTNQPRKINCGYCKAEITVPPFASVVTCEFCGTPNELATGEIIENHNMLEVYFSGSRLTELIPQYLSKYMGVPDDFADKVIFKEFELRMMPFWVFKFHGRTDYAGIGRYVSSSQPSHWSRHIDIDRRRERGTIELDETQLIFGYHERHKEIQDEKIPVGAKVAFDIKAVNTEGGRIFDTEIGYDDAFNYAESGVKSHHQELIYREIDKIENAKQDIELKEVSYLHVPFYRVTYSYGDWTGEALVDASRGKVLRAEYPLSRVYRFWGMIASILSGGLIATGIILAFATNWYIAGIIAAILFLGTLIFGLKELFTGRKVAAE